MGNTFKSQNNQFAWVRFSIKKDDDVLLEQFPKDKAGLSFQFISCGGTRKWQPNEMVAYIRNYLPEPDYEIKQMRYQTSMNNVKKFLRHPSYPTISRKPQLVDWDDFNELVPPENSYWNDVRRNDVEAVKEQFPIEKEEN